MEYKYYSVKEINKFLKDNDLAINKRFGQNFLINAGVVNSLVGKLKLTKDDVVVEIGCGLGSLTHKLLESGCMVIGCEIDLAYIRHLKELFGEQENFTLVEGDFLKKFEEIKGLIPEGKNIIFAGNLPYYITTPIMEKVFTSGLDYSKVCFMMQKEVGERIAAEAGCKQYGSLTVFCQYYTKPEVAVRVGADSFYPAPNVDSIIIIFHKRTDKEEVTNEKLFFKVARSLFISRRKQLKNNLQKSPFLQGVEKETIAEALTNSDIPLKERGENLTIDRIARLTNELDKILKNQ